MPVVCIPLIRFTLLLSFVGNLSLSISFLPPETYVQIYSFFFFALPPLLQNLEKANKKITRKLIKTDYATKQKNADMIFTGVITATYTHTEPETKKNCKFPLLILHEKKTGLSKNVSKNAYQKKLV